MKKLIADDQAFELEIRETADLLLPPKDTFDRVASGLSPKERDSVSDHATAVIVRTSGDATPDQLPARAGFAVASVLADELDGFVYDEVARRIETRAEVDAQAITAPLGSPVFNRRQIVVQLFRDEDGTARLGTLGMSRFGTIDLALRGANMGSGPLLAEVVNAVASKLANGHAEGRITITLDDVAAVIGKTHAEVSTDPKAARPVTLDIVRPERVEGDPDNDMGELIPPGGSSRETWEAVVTSLFGTPSSLRATIDDKELADIASKARRELPGVIKRFHAGEGALFVKGPFSIPTDFRADGGPATELLWVEVASCDADRCTGVLANDPSYVASSNIALGKTTSVPTARSPTGSFNAATVAPSVANPSRR